MKKKITMATYQKEMDKIIKLGEKHNQSAAEILIEMLEKAKDFEIINEEKEL